MQILALLSCLTCANIARADYPFSTGSTITCSTATDVEFVPNWGQVYVDKDQYGKYIIQLVYWESASRMKWFTMNGDSTYEPDAFFGGPNGETPYGYFPRDIGYGNEAAVGYWESDLPSPYQDTAWGDKGNEWTVTVGSANAVLMWPGTVYYTATYMYDGGASSGKVKLSSQRGRRAIPNTPPWVGDYSKWNSYGCYQTPNNVKTIPWEWNITAPGCRMWWYKWNISTNQAC